MVYATAREAVFMNRRDTKPHVRWCRKTYVLTGPGKVLTLTSYPIPRRVGSTRKPVRLLTGGSRPAKLRCTVFGGVLVSTWLVRQRRHAEDGSWASLIIGPNSNC